MRDLENLDDRAFARFMTDYDPHVSMDLHTTNGSRHAYHLTFDDEFNTFDASKWKTSDYWGNRTLSGNGEQQWYSDTAHNGYNPFSVSADGILTITAEPTPAWLTRTPAEFA